MCQWLSDKITWSQLQRVQEQSHIRGMYIWLFVVPLLAKTLQFISDPVDLKIFEYSFRLSTSLPFSWQMFYFSALFLVIGHLFFFMFCPKLIRDHSSPTHFKNEGKGPEQLGEYTRAINLDWGQIRADAHVVDKPQTDDQIYLPKLFWVAYEYANNYMLLARLVSATFYAIGMFLILLVIAENLQTVINLS